MKMKVNKSFLLNVEKTLSLSSFAADTYLHMSLIKAWSETVPVSKKIFNVYFAEHDECLLSVRKFYEIETYQSVVKECESICRSVLSCMNKK